MENNIYMKKLKTYDVEVNIWPGLKTIVTIHHLYVCVCVCASYMSPYSNNVYIHVDIYLNIYIYAYILGVGNGTPLQYSCLETPMDGGAW